MSNHPLIPPGGLALPPPLTLYIHLPWCVRKCPYCDFNSHAQREGLPEARYVEALGRDLEAALPAIWGRPIEAVFFGGGTPSLFSPEAIDAILTRVRTLTRLNPLAEITLEANPGTFERERFQGYRQAGVNRLSLGIQSFNDDHLRALGRIHSAAEAVRAAEAALALFDSVNLDLMYALPGQSLDQAEADLRQAIALGSPHLSAYHLTLEPNTVFAAHPPALPDDELAADMQERVEARLLEAGYGHYETSAFARPGSHCRHNLNYWLFGDYLGIGAGAHSKLSFHDKILRQARVKHPEDYLRKAGSSDGVSEERSLRRSDLPFEFMMNALRLTEGFDSRLFQERTGLPLSQVEAELAEAEARGLLERGQERIRPTPTGRRFLNELLQLFLK
ncbi:anaerobic coproporphyrinogen III oxidase [Sulfuritortus calidifontis]|uniref:Heme chaperone HemW n=1 Tax=Sulfuritortus calidifontis TaxID=1914471 RepID=A0A4R3JWK1_9PROT|nr:radical SAM family heme chaperone HemW [Sulfuritortus calidifontis]TCS72698.1 anaerobic coproporphyrinogen III oxidase [Sulfuritortus calidifontis]